MNTLAVASNPVGASLWKRSGHNLWKRCGRSRSGAARSGTTVNTSVTADGRLDLPASDRAGSAMAVGKTGLCGITRHAALNGFSDSRDAVHRARPGLAARVAGLMVLAGEAAAGPGTARHAVRQPAASGLAGLRAADRTADVPGPRADRGSCVEAAVPAPPIRAAVAASPVTHEVRADQLVHGTGEAEGERHRGDEDRPPPHLRPRRASSMPGSWMLRGCCWRKRTARDLASFSRPSRTRRRMTSASRSSDSRPAGNCAA